MLTFQKCWPLKIENPENIDPNIFWNPNFFFDPKFFNPKILTPPEMVTPQNVEPILFLEQSFRTLGQLRLGEK